MIRLAVLLYLLAGPALADFVTVTRIVRPGETLVLTDLALVSGTASGAIPAPEAALGQEARVVLYPGRPLRPGDLQESALVHRNALIELVFIRHGLQIIAEGRALDRGAEGEMVRVLNTASRLRVTGRVLPDGRVRVD